MTNNTTSNSNLLKRETELISIIVPCYNVQRYLKKCVKSLCTQTYTKLEIILVNDGSQDNTGKLCDKLAFTDKRIRCIHKLNGGPSSARNCGIKESRGEFIVFIDPDDWIEHDMLERLYLKAVEKNVDIVSCGYIREILFFKSRHIAPFKENTVFDHDYITNHILINLCKHEKDISLALNNPTKIYRADLLIENGLFYNEEWFHAEDVNFMIRVLLHAQNILFLNFTPYHYVKPFAIKTLTSRFWPNRFEQQLRYRKFMEETLAPIYGLTFDTLCGWKSIIRYAHENGIDICTHEKDRNKQKDALKNIFYTKDYRYCLARCHDDELEEPFVAEKTAVFDENFEEWYTIIKTHITSKPKRFLKKICRLGSLIKKHFTN